jgi:hypothetical protein
MISCFGGQGSSPRRAKCCSVAETDAAPLSWDHSCGKTAATTTLCPVANIKEYYSCGGDYASSCVAHNQVISLAHPCADLDARPNLGDCVSLRRVLVGIATCCWTSLRACHDSLDLLLLLLPRLPMLPPSKAEAQ